MSSFKGSFGAQLLDDGHTRFRLWAPSIRAANVLMEEIAYPMQQLEDGWYEATIACGPGIHYRFEMTLEDGTILHVADPASRRQAGDVHDASIIVDPNAYRWINTNWQGRPWHEVILYEVHVGLLGGFEGLTRALPALAELGITAIELMPIADFPGTRNWGYDGVLPYAPDAAYGTPEQLKALIDVAHGLNIMVFLDVVYNHFGPDGNYLGAYAKPFFRSDEHTPWGQEIDFRQVHVRDFFTENALYWLQEFRFDGLRFDAVHAINDQSWLQEMGAHIRSTIGNERHIHLVLEHDGNAAHLLDQSAGAPFNAQWNDDGHHVLHTLLTQEDDGYYRDYCEQATEKLARCLSDGFIYQNDPSPIRNNRLRGEISTHLPPTAFVLFLQNHDQTGNRAFGERLTTLARPAALRAAIALVLLSPQIPLLFMGEEIGATQPFLYFASHTGELASIVRDARRREFSGFNTFCDPERQHDIPDPNLAETFTASIPQVSADSVQWQGWIQKLLAIRRTQVIKRLPDCYSLGACVLGEAAVAARWQLGDGAVLALALNLSEADIAVSLDSIAKTGGADLLFETDGTLAALGRDCLPADSFIALLEPAA
jgi:maltooligosyltrehalose trehalohydrolase